MSDRVAKSYHTCDGKSGRSIHPHKSAWMAHWTGTRCDASSHMHRNLSRRPGNMGTDHEIASDISRSSKGLREVEHREVMNESLVMSSKNSSELGCQPFPIVKLCQESGRSSISKNDRDTSSLQASRPQIAHRELPTTLNVVSVPPQAAETSLRECHFQPEGVLQVPAEQVKYHMFFGESSYSCSRPSKEKITGSASHIVPHRSNHGENKYEGGRTAVPSFMRRQEEINQLTSILASKEHLSKTNMTILEQEHCNYHSHSALLVCEENKTALLKNNPHTSSNHSPAFGEEQLQRMQNHLGIGFFPSKGSPPEMTELGKLHLGQCSLQNIPHFVHDVKTMRICTSMDSAEELAGALPRFSQTTRSLSITKHTDVNLSNENQILRESRVKENTFSELHNASPVFGHCPQGVKLQLLGSSIDSEERENVEDVKTSGDVQKNESSAETDIMDMESFKEKNHFSGVNSTPSNKDIMVEPDLAPQAAIALAKEEVRRGKRIIELPDINLELPALPAESSSMEKAEPSTSRTQSLDMDTLLFHADQPSGSKSNNCPDGSLGPEPSSRWVKRLKLSVGNSLALGSKSSNLGEGKENKFTKIMKGSTSSSEPTTGKRYGKEVLALDQTTELLRNVESAYVDTGKKGQDITLSHSWIQRWRHNQAQKKPETLVTCQPQSSKLTFEDFQKKQFPSIAAMALMGKAMTGFQPCEFQKRGSFIVWNTKGF